jgi:hypothetical protein
MSPSPLALLAQIELARPQAQYPEAWRAAFQYVQRALAIDAAHEKALLCRAQVHERAGNLVHAIRDLKRLVARNPMHVEAARELRLVEMRWRNGALGPSGRRADGEMSDEPDTNGATFVNQLLKR